MIMTPRPALARLAQISLLTLLASVHAGCGEGTVTFGGDDDDFRARVTFKGNLDSISPVTSRDIVVFVYHIDDDDSDRCPCPDNPIHEFGEDEADRLVGRTQILSAGETEFSVSGLEPGTFGVVFLLDKSGDNADGEIDEGDLVAVLDDPDCELDDVSGKITVTLEDIDLVFEEFHILSPEPDCTIGDPPADGRARADQIRLKPTVDNDD